MIPSEIDGLPVVQAFAANKKTGTLRIPCPYPDTCTSILKVHEHGWDGKYNRPTSRAGHCYNASAYYVVVERDRLLYNA